MAWRFNRVIVALSLASRAWGQITVIHAARINDVLVNPGMGTQTLQRYNGDPLNAGVQWSEEGPTGRLDPGAAPDFPESTIAYRRWFWQTIEPAVPISTAKPCSGRRALCGNIGSSTVVSVPANPNPRFARFPAT